MLSAVRDILNPDVNPLRNLPPAQRFQVSLYLAVMWTTIFCAGAGVWMYYGALIVVHVLVALGLLVTSLTFHRAGAMATYEALSLKDEYRELESLPDP